MTSSEATMICNLLLTSTEWRKLDYYAPEECMNFSLLDLLKLISISTQIQTYLQTCSKVWIRPNLRFVLYNNIRHLSNADDDTLILAGDGAYTCINPGYTLSALAVQGFTDHRTDTLTIFKGERFTVPFEIINEPRSANDFRQSKVQMFGDIKSFILMGKSSWTIETRSYTFCLKPGLDSEFPVCPVAYSKCLTSTRDISTWLSAKPGCSNVKGMKELVLDFCFNAGSGHVESVTNGSAGVAKLNLSPKRHGTLIYCCFDWFMVANYKTLSIYHSWNWSINNGPSSKTCNCSSGDDCVWRWNAWWRICSSHKNPDHAWLWEPISNAVSTEQNSFMANWNFGQHNRNCRELYNRWNSEWSFSSYTQRILYLPHRKDRMEQIGRVANK